MSDVRRGGAGDAARGAHAGVSAHPSPALPPPPAVISTANAPFGGVGDSGYGREGAREGLLEYTNLKYVMSAV
jgi:hypothetical protein